MVSSTAIPKAILKIMAVLGFKGIPKNPIIPPVINNGIIVAGADGNIYFLGK